MADNLPLRNDDTTFVGSVATEEVSGVHFPRNKIALGVVHEDDGDVGDSNPMPVKWIQATNPQIAIASATIAPGGEDELSSTQITTDKTGKLLKVIVTGSVPFKATLKTVANAVESTAKGIGIVRAGGEWVWESPGLNFVTVDEDSAAGFDGFRVEVKNLDVGPSSSDFYATFYYDETDQA